MIDFIRRAFGHEPLLGKEDIGRRKRKEDQRASDVGGTLKRLWQVISAERKLLSLIVLRVTLTSLLSITGPFLVGCIVDNDFVQREFDGLFRSPIVLTATYGL